MLRSRGEVCGGPAAVALRVPVTPTAEPSANQPAKVVIPAYVNGPETTTASAETVMVEAWRMYGFLVFAELFVPLAIIPRRCAGAWELVAFYKGATSVTAALVVEEATAASSMAVVGSILAAGTIATYFAARGYAGWARLRGTH